DRPQLAGRPGGDGLGAQFAAHALPRGDVEVGIEMRIEHDPPDGVERFGRLVGLGGRGGRGRDDDHRRGEEAFHLMSALMTAGGSNTVGSTVSNSTVSRVIFCSIPMIFCVSTVACVSLPNCL